MTAGYRDRRAGPGRGALAGAVLAHRHGMAALLILLTAVDEGLGAVYFGIVPPAVPRFRAAFGVPDEQEPIGAIAIGHDAEPRARDLRSRRLPLAEMVRYGHW